MWYESLVCIYQKFETAKLNSIIDGICFLIKQKSDHELFQLMCRRVALVQSHRSRFKNRKFPTFYTALLFRSLKGNTYLTDLHPRAFSGLDSLRYMYVSASCMLHVTVTVTCPVVVMYTMYSEKFDEYQSRNAGKWSARPFCAFTYFQISLSLCAFITQNT